MIGFLLRRLVQAVIVCIGVLLIVFLLSHLIPGGEARGRPRDQSHTEDDPSLQRHQRIHASAVGPVLPVPQPAGAPEFRLFVLVQPGCLGPDLQQAPEDARAGRDLDLARPHHLHSRSGSCRWSDGTSPSTTSSPACPSSSTPCPPSCSGRFSSCTSPSTSAGSRWACHRARRWATSCAIPGPSCSPRSRWPPSPSPRSAATCAPP